MGRRIGFRSVELEIVEQSKKGNGIGFIENPDGKRWLVEVPFAVPGDIVRALLFRKRSGVYQGRMEELVKPSKQRIQPRCIHFGACGGCRWQQVSYNEQLQYKENVVRSTFASLITPSVSFRPIVSSESPWEYRNKMEFSFPKTQIKGNFLA